MSYAGYMAASIRERYPPPWRVEQIPGGFRVVASNCVPVAYVYGLAGHARSAAPNSLTPAEALAIAQAISRLADDRPE